MTQVALAGAVGVSQTDLSTWEGGYALPAWAELERVAKALSVTPSDIYSDDIIRALRAGAEVA